MRIIAIENNIVVDVFQGDQAYLYERKANRSDIDFIVSDVGYMGQIRQKDGTFTDPPQPPPLPPEQPQPKQVTNEQLMDTLVWIGTYGGLPNL